MARTRRRRAGSIPEADIEPSLDIDRIVRRRSDPDQVGLTGLSMRRLAEQLGIQAATLYWYIRDKQELLSLLAEAIYPSAAA